MRRLPALGVASRAGSIELSTRKPLRRLVSRLLTWPLMLPFTVGALACPSGA